MADPPSSPATTDPNPHRSGPDNPTSQPDAAPSTSTSYSAQENQSSTPNLNSNQRPAVPPQVPLPNQPIQPYGVPPPPPFSVPPTAPSYRPVPIPGAPQFSPLQNYQAPGVQPPGVSGGAPGTVGPPMMTYSGVPGQAPNMTLRPFAPMPNGYGVVTAPAPVL